MSSSRRSSASSLSSIAGPSSPLISPTSPSELVLVQDEDDLRGEAFDFSSDDDLADELGAQSERLKSSAIPPLSPTLVFLYLLFPYLKLGPLLIPTSDTPLSHSVPALLVFALLTLVAHQLWYMLAKYIRKVDLEEVILDAFARGGGKERRRQLLRSLVRFGTGSVRILLASVYLRQSVEVILPLLPARLLVPLRVGFTVAFTLVGVPLYFAPSISAKRLLYAAWFSLVAYIVWLGAVSYAHAKGTLTVNPNWPHMGSLWQGTTTTAFIFASSWTLSLYAALRGSAQPVATKRSRRRSFKALSAISVLVAVGFTLPLFFFAASPNMPRDMQNDKSRPQNVLIATANAVNLVLTVPIILVTSPPLPIPLVIRRRTNLSISKAVTYILTSALSILPNGPSAVISNMVLILTLLSTYVLPAVIHITVHHFKRPLAIVLPTASTSSSAPRGDGGGADSTDELLQRKERTLQRRRLGRRLAWDVVAWIMAVPFGAGGLVWAIGTIAGKW